MNSDPGFQKLNSDFSLVSRQSLHCMSSTGASSGAIDLLPTHSAANNWTAGLLMDSNDMVFKFDGKQGAKIPDGIVPKNLTDHFTITMWMKHGPSPGLRAEKETILCNSDKTGNSKSVLHSSFKFKCSIQADIEK